MGKEAERAGPAHIPVYSPQAKGRIQRLWGTLQHPLITQMSIANISYQEANDFLPGFIEGFKNPSPPNPPAPRQITCPAQKTWPHSQRGDLFSVQIRGFSGGIFTAADN